MEGVLNVIQGSLIRGILMANYRLAFSHIHKRDCEYGLDRHIVLVMPR